MKKISYFLLLFLFSAGTAAAQGNFFEVGSSAIDVSTLENSSETNVVIHVGGTSVNKWLQVSSDGYNEGVDVINQTNASHIYVLVKDANGNLAIKDNRGYYMPKWAGTSFGQFSNDQTSAQAYLFNAVSSPSNSQDANGNAYTLTGSDTNGLPLVYLTNNNRLGVNGSNNQTCEDITFQFFSVTPTLSFETGKVYTIQVRTLAINSNSYMKRLSSSYTNVKSAKGNTPDYFWTFEAATEEGKYYIRNLNGPAKDGKYLAITGTSNQPSYTYEGTAYTIEPHPTLWKQGAFVICISETKCLGGHTENGAALYAWENARAKTDGGSAFIAREIDWTNFAENMQTFNNAAPNRTFGNNLKIRSFSYDVGAEDEITAASTSPTVENVATALGTVSIVQPSISQDKVYRFISNTRSGQAISYGFYAEKDGSINVDNNGRPIVSENYQNNFINTLYQLTETGTEGKYNLKNLNTGTMVGSASSGTQLQMCGIGYEQYAGSYDIEVPSVSESSDDTKWLFHLGGTTDNTYINSLNGSGDTKIGIYTRNWAGSLDGGNLWQIQEVTDIPVAISVAGWSTLKLPVATIIPSGINVYYVTSIHGDCVYVEEITGTLPANTPVLLKGTASATYNFTITTSDATNPTGNKLDGTTAKRQGFSSDTEADPDLYGLLITPASNGGTAEDTSDDTPASAAFVPAYSSKIPANKAFLPYANVNSSGSEALTAKLSIIIGEPTGITPIRTEVPSNVLFDLSGRRILYPVHGRVYINGNGQKLIFK